MNERQTFFTELNQAPKTLLIISAAAFIGFNLLEALLKLN